MVLGNGKLDRIGGQSHGVNNFKATQGKVIPNVKSSKKNIVLFRCYRQPALASIVIDLYFENSELAIMGMVSKYYWIVIFPVTALRIDTNIYETLVSV